MVVVVVPRAKDELPPSPPSTLRIRIRVRIKVSVSLRIHRTVMVWPRQNRHNAPQSVESFLQGSRLKQTHTETHTQTDRQSQ